MADTLTLRQSQSQRDMAIINASPIVSLFNNFNTKVGTTAITSASIGIPLPPEVNTTQILNTPVDLKLLVKHSAPKHVICFSAVVEDLPYTGIKQQDTIWHSNAKKVLLNGKYIAEVLEEFVCTFMNYNRELNLGAVSIISCHGCTLEVGHIDQLIGLVEFQLTTFGEFTKTTRNL